LPEIGVYGGIERQVAGEPPLEVEAGAADILLPFVEGIA